MDVDSDLIATEDGSLSLLDPFTGELYHNRAGAFTEALYSYCIPSAAIEHLKAKGSLRLLDACFGLGYNSFVLLQQVFESQPAANLDIKIVAVELDPKIIEKTAAILRDERFKLLESSLSSTMPLNVGVWKFAYKSIVVELQLIQADLRQLVPQMNDDFDLIYHDPFSARKVPELWTLDLFCQYHRLLSAREGRLLTYSAAKAVRGGLHSAGFFLYKTSGVGGKSGGTLASVKNLSPLPANVLDLPPEELKVLASRSATPYRDNGFGSRPQEIFERRARELESK